MVFTSLGHLINKEMLENCHVQMDGTKAVGIDGITKEEYGRSLEENINALIEHLKKKSYKPKPARLVEIPKEEAEEYQSLTFSEWEQWEFPRNEWD